MANRFVVEGDHDVPIQRRLQNGHHRLAGLVEPEAGHALTLDLHEGITPRLCQDQLDSLGERRHPNATILSSQPLAIVDLDPPQALQRQVENRLVPAGGAQEARIVHQDGYPVGGELHVELDVAGAGLERGPQGL